jgi:hypothetical protein
MQITRPFLFDHAFAQPQTVIRKEGDEASSSAPHSNQPNPNHPVMKKLLVILIGLIGLAAPAVKAQTLVNSWENSLEGWTNVEPGIWTATTFSTTTGVTAGTYSWVLTAASGPNYGVALSGPASTNLTALLANAAAVNVDVSTPVGGSFGYYLQFELAVSLPGFGSTSFDGGTYSQSPSIGAAQSTLTYTVPLAVRQLMAAHPGLAANLTFAIGGGGSGTMYMDNLRIAPLGLINSFENSPEGWTIEEGNWTSTGFSKTTGVTSGQYSWQLTAAGSPDYGLPLQGPSSAALTTLLANAGSISIDVLAQGFSYMQFDAEINGTSLDGYSYNQSPTIGTESTLTWTIPQSVRTALLNNPTQTTSITFQIGGGNGGTMYIDNLRAALLPPAPAKLFVRELWDDYSTDLQPALTSVGDNSSSAGFVAADPWVGNPAETPTNTQLMAFRTGFPNENSLLMGLPGSLDGTTGCMVQQNNGFSFFPPVGGPTFWTEGDFLTRQLAVNNFINFQAVGEYWFSMTIANATNSLDAQYVTFPASGAGGIGFADGSTTNADFVAVGVTGLNLYFGPTNVSLPFGATNASKAVYISQGTLDQPGNSNSTIYNPITDPAANPPDSPPNYAPPYNSEYSQTNFTSGPYHVNAFGAAGNVTGDGIVVLGHLKTFGNGTATLDAKYYTATGAGNSWNLNLDTNPATIQWDCSYSFNFGGTMTQMLLFQNGQFPFYVFGFRASSNFSDVVGLDPGRISVSPLTNTYAGYPINMANLAVEANSFSFISPPVGYGALTYQWYQNGIIIPSATSQTLDIPIASTNDPSMPAGTDAGTYTSVATDPSGTWGPVTNSVVVTVTNLLPPQPTSFQLFGDQSTFQIIFNEPNLNGAGNAGDYVFSGGVVATNVSVTSTATTTQVQLQTTTMPIGTKLTLTISGITNVVGGTLTTNISFWTDLQQTGVVNWDAWASPISESAGAYFGTFIPGNPHPYILSTSMLPGWEGPTSGVTINGGNGVGSDFGDRMYGWFIPPATTNYVFFISTDDGGRLSLSTNSSSTNIFVIACETDWNGADQWTNISDEFPSQPHRGDGTASGTNAVANYVWDNTGAACDQNRSDQFITAYFDGANLGVGLPGEPTDATLAEQAVWAASADVSQGSMTTVIQTNTENFWPNRDANGHALISLVAGQKYFMQLEHINNTGGYDESVTYKFAGAPDPVSPGATVLTGSNIAALVPFTPTISIAELPGGPRVTYTGVLYSGSSLTNITNVVSTSSGGPSIYNPPHTAPKMFYRTSE